MNKTIKKDQLSLLLMLYPAEKRSFKEQWDEFKYAYHMSDLRELLAKSLEACLCSDYPDFQQARVRSNIAFFFQAINGITGSPMSKRYERG
jgi:hypothetical protein